MIEVEFLFEFEGLESCVCLPSPSTRTPVWTPWQPVPISCQTSPLIFCNWHPRVTWDVRDVWSRCCRLTAGVEWIGDVVLMEVLGHVACSSTILQIKAVLGHIRCPSLGIPALLVGICSGCHSAEGRHVGGRITRQLMWSDTYVGIHTSGGLRIVGGQVSRSRFLVLWQNAINAFNAINIIWTHCSHNSSPSGNYLVTTVYTPAPTTCDGKWILFRIRHQAREPRAVNKSAQSVGKGAWRTNKRSPWLDLHY